MRTRMKWLAVPILAVALVPFLADWHTPLRIALPEMPTPKTGVGKAVGMGKAEAVVAATPGAGHRGRPRRRRDRGRGSGTGGSGGGNAGGSGSDLTGMSVNRSPTRR